MSHRRFSSTARRGKSNHGNHRSFYKSLAALELCSLATKGTQEIAALDLWSLATKGTQEIAEILSDDSHLDDCFIPGSRNKGLLLFEES